MQSISSHRTLARATSEPVGDMLRDTYIQEQLYFLFKKDNALVSARQPDITHFQTHSEERTTCPEIDLLHDFMYDQP